MGILDDAIREHLELKRSHGASEEEVNRQEVEAFGPVRQDAAAAVAEPPVAEPVASVAEPPVAEPVASEPVAAEPLEPAPDDPYAVHPGDELVPDEHDVLPTHTEEPTVAADPLDMPTEPHPAPPAAEAGAGMLEPHQVDPGPPTPPEHHHHEERHPALHDTGEFHREEHPPEPVFRPAAQEAEPSPPDAPLQPAPEDPYIGDPPSGHPGVDEPPPRQSPETADEHEVGEIEGPAEDVLEETPEFLQDAPEHDRLWFEQKPPRDFDFGE